MAAATERPTALPLDARETTLDLNQLYSDHQAARMRADSAVSDGFRDDCLSDAARLAGEIAKFQTSLGAAAALAWTAKATKDALHAGLNRARQVGLPS